MRAKPSRVPGNSLPRLPQLWSCLLGLARGVRPTASVQRPRGGGRVGYPGKPQASARLCLGMRVDALSKLRPALFFSVISLERSRMKPPRSGMSSSASRVLVGTRIAGSRVRRVIFAFHGLGANLPAKRPLWTSRVERVVTLVCRLFPSVASMLDLVLGHAQARHAILVRLLRRSRFGHGMPRTVAGPLTSPCLTVGLPTRAADMTCSPSGGLTR